MSYVAPYHKAKAVDVPAYVTGGGRRGDFTRTPAGPGYPVVRERVLDVEHKGVVADVFPRHQTTGGFVALTDTLAEVIRFAGKPENIEIWVRNQDAAVVFTEETQSEREVITVPAGVFYEPKVTAEVIMARNATAGLTASIQVIGKWAQPASR